MGHFPEVMRKIYEISEIFLFFWLILQRLLDKDEDVIQQKKTEKSSTSHNMQDPRPQPRNHKETCSIVAELQTFNLESVTQWPHKFCSSKQNCQLFLFSLTG